MKNLINISSDWWEYPEGK